METKSPKRFRVITNSLVCICLFKESLSACSSQDFAFQHQATKEAHDKMCKRFNRFHCLTNKAECLFFRFRHDSHICVEKQTYQVSRQSS